MNTVTKKDLEIEKSILDITNLLATILARKKIISVKGSSINEDTV